MNHQQRLEQRAHPRKKIIVPCLISDGQIVRYASLGDISVDGARLYSAAPPPIGKIIQLRFTLNKNAQEIEAHGRVIWRSEGYQGRGGVLAVQFTHVSDLGQIAAYIDHQNEINS